MSRSRAFFTDAVFAEMGTKARFRSNQKIEGSLIVGRSGNAGRPTTEGELREGRTLPGTQRYDRSDRDNDFPGAHIRDGPASFCNVMFIDVIGNDVALRASNSVRNAASHTVEGLTWNKVEEADRPDFGGGSARTSSFARAITNVDGSLTVTSDETLTP